MLKENQKPSHPKKYSTMKAKAACIGTPKGLVDYLSSTEFAAKLLTTVVGNALGVHDVLDRPSEYYLQNADEGPSASEGKMGVEVRLTGVSRNNRNSKQFKDASVILQTITKSAVKKHIPRGQRCQVFTVVMCDKEVEIASGTYTATIEHEAEWVEGEADV